jgi:hypothetical protein
MIRARAVTLAIQCLASEIKRLAVQANLHDRYGADTPACVEASRRRTELRAAIEALRQPTQKALL